MGKRARATDQTRDRIRVALMKLLGNESYGSITIADVAKAAGVSTRTVQRQYGSKDEILAAMIRRPSDLVEAKWRKVAASNSARDAIRSFVTLIFEIYLEQDAEAWAAFSRSDEAPELGETLRNGIEARRTRIRDMVKSRGGELRLGTEEAAQMLLGFTGYFTWRGLTKYSGYSSPEAAEMVTNLLCQTLLRDR